MCSECRSDFLKLGLELVVVPIPVTEVGGEAVCDQRFLRALPFVEQIAVQVERDQRQHLATVFPAKLSFFLDSLVDLCVDLGTSVVW